MKRLMRKLVAVAVSGVICGLLLGAVTAPPAARAQSPDVIRAATNWWQTIVMSNTTDVAVAVVTNVTIARTNANRVRLLVYPDAAQNAWIGYGGTTVTTTNAFPLWGGSTNPWVTARPALWKSPITICVTSSVASQAVTTARFRVVDESTQ